MKLKNQKFVYDEINKSWTNAVSKNAVETVGGVAKDNANLVTSKFEAKPGQLWTYSYVE